MAVILDGKATSAQVRGEIATAARALTERTGVVPGLAVVIVGRLRRSMSGTSAVPASRLAFTRRVLNCPPTRRRRHWRRWWTD